jgi:glycosyltransferase involved in cell wall biosynthesis
MSSPDSLRHKRNAISSLSSAGRNPYLDLFYGALETLGVPRGPAARLRVLWLLAHRRDVRYLHVHWPQPLYRFERGPARIRPLLSYVKLALLAVRLRTARALGYRVVWTVHQVYPHGSATRLDRAGAGIVVRNAALLVAHDPETAARGQRELAPARAIEVVPHGSYVGVYPAGRARDDVRDALRTSLDAVVFLSFGEIRTNSDSTVLLEAFAKLSLDSVSLLVAGNAKDPRAGRAAAAAAEADDRVVRIDGFVPLERVRELYDAADVAVVSRGDGGTSGSLILALSLGKPVVAADTPVNRRLLAEGSAGWLFRPGDADDLRRVLEAAAADEAARASRGATARRLADALDWDDAAATFAALLPE